MKKEMTAILAAGLMFIAACGVNNAGAGDVNERTDIIEETQTEDQTQIPNPFIDCETMEEAEKLAGFSLTAPESMDGYEKTVIQAIEGELVQVIFTSDDQDTTHDLMIRKGTGMEDISGDYNVYPKEETVTVDGRDVTMREKEEVVYTAIWNAEGYSYAVLAADGLSLDAMTALIREIA